MPEISATSSALATAHKRINRIPLSTYRLQLGPDLNLGQVRQLLPYLQRLGISDLYLSPLFRARAESSHGYDVVDHGTIDPAIGDIAAFEELAESARAVGMGILLDVVPNHMGINDPGNAWWLDVLENGEGSFFADFFDIDWRPAASGLHDKVLLPFLGEPFGAVLERGELQIAYADERLQLRYFDRRFPLAPATWIEVLELAALRQDEAGGASDGGTFENWIEFQSIITQLKHLPEPSDRSPATMEERYREQKIVRGRLVALLTQAPAVRAAFDAAIAEFNGEAGNAKSFDRLEQLLERQWYRLANWRVAVDEINYRRFFDVNDLAAIRVENPRVFEAVHRLVGRFLAAGWVTGLRIDHPDGLWDPLHYFKSLQSLYRSQQPTDANEGADIYIAAEKILSGDEELPVEWAVCGTTGYDFMNVVGRLLVNGDGLAQIREPYDRLTGNAARPADVIYESKRTVLFSTMASELQMLGARLYRIAQKHRASRDFTRPMLQRALREVIASMTVYRTYVRGDCWDISDADYRTVTTAVRMAKRRNTSLPTPVFDYIASVLLLEHPPTISDELASERREFALKLQQVSGPVAAKGVEDTAFYRYYPLVSLNEVGGELDAKPIAVEEFHRLMRRRVESWPHSMSATSTHDSKRGEDFRARVHVLSEMPTDWEQAIRRWQQMNAPLRREVDGEPVPDANEEYLLYQTLVGTWPVRELAGGELEHYRDRMVQYILKALHEAKVHTSWMNPSGPYDAAVRDFVGDLFDEKGAAFRADLRRFAVRIANAGFANSLAQVVLKITSPGVPDFYQGTELWDFSLVDPDNRRAVDFVDRERRLNALLKSRATSVEATAADVSRRWPDADAKLWTTEQCVNLRHEWPDVFSFGEYIPGAVIGESAEHVVAFARRFEEKWVIAVVPRQIYRLCDGTAGSNTGPPRADWSNTRIVLAAEWPQMWRCRISGREFDVSRSNGEPIIEIGRLLEVLPVAVLTNET